MTFSLVVKTLDSNGGTERNALGFAQWLSNQGHRVVVYCAKAMIEVNGIEVKVKPMRARGRLLKTLAWPRWIASLPKALPNEKRLCFIRGAKGGVYRAGGGSHAAWIRHKGWTLMDEIEKRQDRRSCLQADRIIVNSNLSKQALVRDYQISEDKVRLCRNGVDTALFVPSKNYKTKAPTALFVGNGYYRKGLDIAIEALTFAKAFQLNVVGHDRLEKEYRKFAGKMGVADRVVFYGSRPNPEDFMKEATVFVLPSRYDPSANACLESLACGVPFVSTLSNGATELAPFDWMVQPLEPSRVAEGMKWAMDTENVKTICRQVALENHSDLAFKRLYECLIQQ